VGFGPNHNGIKDGGGEGMKGKEKYQIFKSQ